VENEREFADEVGTVLSGMGLPAAFGKLMGWLLICEPPQQTSTQLVEALGLSKGSVSTGMRALEQLGMVRRVPVRGRGHAYEMLPDALVRTVDARRVYAVIHDVMQKGIEVLGGDEQLPRAQRLRITRDFYAFVGERVPQLIDEFARQEGLLPPRKDE
jgi:DNA-binding transcriptional regulator GbsR (MarR family)